MNVAAPSSSALPLSSSPGGVRAPPRAEKAQAALALVTALQARFVDGLTALARARGDGATFTATSWLRDGGRHGGGERFGVSDSGVFQRGSVNVSCVHYDDEPNRRLAAAVALSTIIHPQHPRAPSVHVHVSWTGLRDGSGGWRAMADLNPSHLDEGDRARFAAAVEAAAGPLSDKGRAQGDRYFFIPALGRTRGVTHFYVEGYATPDFTHDAGAVRTIGEAALDTYVAILADALARSAAPTAAEQAAQLAYHTLYLFQVLTLDRGTTSGLLIHAENDLGIMGSLPAFVDRALLASWASRVPTPQDALVRALVDALPEGARSAVTDDVKLRLAAAVRAHYGAHPEALALQAAGDFVPPTVDNHGVVTTTSR